MKKPNAFVVAFFLFSVASFGLVLRHAHDVSRAPNVVAASGVDIVVTKTDDKTTVSAGQTNTYTLIATNVGTVTADYAYVYDFLPAVYDPSTTVLSCPSCYHVEGNGTAEPYAEMSLAPGQSVIVTISAKVKPAAQGIITNTVQSGAWPTGTEGNTGNNTATDTTQIGIAPSPTPSVSPLPSSSPSSSPTPTPSPTISPSPSPILTPAPTSTPIPQPTTLERGLWFYDRTLPIGQGKIDETLTQAQKYGFNAIYYTIEEYPALLARNDQVKIGYMRDALRKLTVQARQKGISIDAYAGRNNWGEQAGFKDALSTTDFVMAYNRAAPENERVRSLQFDVEPHTLSKYERNKAAILTRFVGMLDAVTQRIASENVSIGFDVVAPHFYDSVQNWTPQITYNGKKQYVYNHVLDLLQRVGSSRYVIMDYVNYTDTPTGSIELARPEIEQASAAQSKTKVVIALETGNYPPVEVISYYGMCRSRLEGDMLTLHDRFRNEPAFGGFAIDSYLPYLALKDC